MKISANINIRKNGIITFAGIDLEDSWIIGWEEFENKLIFNVEFSIWKDSEHYETPKVEEYTCYKKGQIIFLNAAEIKGLSILKSSNPNVDLDGSLDWGNIFNLRIQNSQISFETDYCKIVLIAQELILKIN